MAPEKLRPQDHPGVEFIYVIQGTLSVHMNGEEHALEAGDAIYFDATIPHAYRRSGGRRCSAVVVTASSPSPALVSFPEWADCGC